MPNPYNQLIWFSWIHTKFFFLLLVEKDWVQGEYDLFMEKNPSGQIKKADALKRLEAAAKERFPNAVPENVAQALYPAFDPEDKGEVGFVAAAKGLAILFCARIEIRAQLFFS